MNNRFMITRKQAIMLFLICTISSKLQKLPCLLACEVSSDIWQVLLLGALFDIVFIILTIAITNLCPQTTIADMLNKTFGKTFGFIIGAMLLFYFICTSLMPYQAVRDVFASNLFDKLSWQIFSIFLLLTVGYLAFSGMRTIGRTAELYFWIISVSVVALITLGLITSPLSNVLPAFTTPFNKVLRCTTKHSIWFGDYLIFYVLIGHIKPNKTALKFTDTFYYLGAILIYSAAYVAFYGLYTVLFSTQTSLLTSISSFSLLDLDIGRADWFLVLFSQIASVISCSTYIYCATNCLNRLTGNKHYGLCLIACLLVLYFTDIFGFGNIDAGITMFILITKWPATIIQTIVPVICFISALILYRRNKKQSSNGISLKQNNLAKTKTLNKNLSNSGNKVNRHCKPLKKARESC